MKDRHCKRGHFRPASDTRPFCRECTNAWRKDHPEIQRAYKLKRRQQGIEHHGLTKNVLHAIGRDKIVRAIEAVRQTGRMRAAYPIIPQERWSALGFFYPKLRSQMDKTLAAARAERRASIIRPAGPAIIRRVDASLLHRLNEAVGRHLARDHRQDVIADMVEAFMRKTLSEADIERRASEFVNARYKSDHDKWGDVSLDLPASRDGATPLISTIEQGLWSEHVPHRATKSSNGVWR